MRERPHAAHPESISRGAALLPLLALVLTACTPEGYPSGHTELWILFAFLGWLYWLTKR
jgi:hypothetical protein